MKKIHIIFIAMNLFFLAESRGQGITANDILIAQDSIHSAAYDEQTVWNLRRSLMEKLLHDTSLVATDTTISNFYSAHLNDNIGKLSSIRVALDTLHGTDTTIAAIIQSNIALIQSNMLLIATKDSILANDTTLSGTDSLAIDSLIGGNDSTIAAYAAINDSIYTVLQTSIYSNAASIKSRNDALVSDSIYVQNEITVNSIYLGTVAAGHLDSVYNYATTLYNIAKQCPLKGGLGVFYARSLYHLISDTVTYDDDRICRSSDTCLVPATPGAISGVMVGVCGKSNLIYVVTPDPVVSSYTWSLNDTLRASISGSNTADSVIINFRDSVHYVILSVSANNSCGSSAPRSIAISGFPASPDSITGTSSVDECGIVSALPFSSDSVESATSYTWVVPSGCTIDSGQGTTHIYVDWGSLPGNVIVVATNACGSSDSTVHAVSIIECRTTAAAKHNIAGSPGNGNVKIYPNPTTGKLTLEYNLNANKGMLQLFDLVGQKVGSYQLDGNSSMFEFDASYLCCGVFEYRVMDDESLKGQGKLVIIR